MAFTQNTFGPISSHGNSNMPNLWTYHTQDTSAAVRDEMYFVAKHPILHDGDFVAIQASDDTLFGKFEKTVDGFTIQPLLGGGAVTGNKISITKLEDFDNYDDTTVTLSPGFEYGVCGLVDISPRRLVADSAVSFSGIGYTIAAIISDVDTGALINTQSSLFCSDMTFQTTGDAEMFNCTGQGLFNIRDTAFLGGSAGKIQFDSISTGSLVFKFCAIDASISPLEIGGEFVRIDFDELFPPGQVIPAGTTFIDFQSDLVVNERISIVKGFADIDTGGVGYNFQSVAGLPAESVQALHGTFKGVGSPFVGLDAGDNEAFFRDNVGQVSSFSNSGYSIDGNVLATVISVIGTPVLINTDNITEATTTQRFTFSAINNDFTYDGVRSRAFQINSVFVLETTLNNQRIGLQLFKNGSPTNIVFTTTTSGSGGTRVDNLSLSGALNIDANDVIDVRVFNITSTDNITVLDAAFQIAQIG